MNIYQKINEARIRFQKLNIKMGGENTFAKYNYYELGDILPHMNLICAEVGLCNLVSFSDPASITIVDVEKPEDREIIYSPMSTASLKGCHEVQNLGAVETYIRRYLYQTAYEIVESDVLNKTQNPNEAIQKKDAVSDLKDRKMTDDDTRRMALDMLNASAMPNDKKEAWLKGWENRSMIQVNTLIDILQGTRK